MKISEKVIEAIINNIIDMDLPDFDITGSSISNPEIVDEEIGICKMNIEITLKKRIDLL